MNSLIPYEHSGDRLRDVDIPSLLENSIPEFWSVRTFPEVDSPHIVAGDFAVWFRGQLNQRGIGDFPLASRAFRLIEDLAERGDSSAENVLVVSILEVLIDDLPSYPQLREHISGRARLLLDRVILNSYN